jgi:membrane protein
MTNVPKYRGGSKVSVVLRLLKRVIEEWNADDAMSWSASVAFYTLLSFAPLLILMAAIAGFVYGQDAAQGALVSGLRNLVSPDISLVVRTMLMRPHGASTSWIAALFGALTLFFGASSVLMEIHDALNAIWHVTADPNATERAALFRLMKERVYSFIVIVGCGTLLLISLMLENWLGAVQTAFGWRLVSSGVWFQAFIFVMAFLTTTFVFAAIYKLIPDVELNWRDVAIGGVATSLLLVAGKQLIALYISKADMGSAYGAAGSLIVVLVWVYYSAQVFFLGAEFTKLYAETFGSRKQAAEPLT